MPAIRLSFLTALLIALVHAAAGTGAPADALVVLRNLLWWQLLTAVAGTILAALAWWVLARRHHTIAMAFAPAVLIALELWAAMVAANLHHTLGPPLRAAAFAAAGLIPALLLLALLRRPFALRWMMPVQIALLFSAIGVQVLVPGPDGRAGTAPDLALFVLDAVQVRALGHMGAPLDPSPNLDRLAAEGWTADAAFSAATTSIPGHAAILFGLDVAEHRAPTNNFNLPPDLPAPLAERLKQRGYRTMGFCQNPLISRNGGFARGFDVWWNWDDQTWLGQPLPIAVLHWPAIYLWTRATHIDRVTLTARATLETARGPQFTFMQFLYTHDPYTDGDGWLTPERVATVRKLYDRGELSNRTGYDPDEIAWLYTNYLASVAYTDRLVGEMVDALETRAGDRGLVVVITSDHGENLAEHTDAELSRHCGPWSTSLRIPLIVHDSRTRTDGVRSSRLSSHQRIERLLLDAADGRLAHDPAVWADQISDDLALDPLFIFSEPWLVVVDDSLKVAIDRTNPAAPPLVHRWRTDFEDQEQVAGLETIQRRWNELLHLQERMAAAGLFEVPEDIDPDRLEHLRALGYIE